MERLLGLDLGSVTLGVSVSDLLGMIASTVVTLRFKEDDYDDALEQLKPYIKQYQIKKVVLGLPKHMNGDIGIRGEICLEFKKKLEAIGIEVIMWDERLTTVRAQNVLLEANVSRKKRKKIIDKLAAVEILQAYLDRQHF